MPQVSLNYKPRAWQEFCHKMPQRFRVIAVHRRGGKTRLALMELIAKALKFNKELGLFVYCAPFRSQAKTIAWAILKLILQPIYLTGGCEINEGDLIIKFLHNGAQIRLLGGDNPDAMRGVRLDGCVIDEVAQIKPEVWTDILQPALSDRKGWAIFIGTPSGLNLFSELFYKAQTLTDWGAKLYTVYDTESIDPVEVERLRRDMAPASFEREYLCNFSAAGDDQLIGLQDIEDAAARVYKFGEFSYAAKIIGVDPARFGDDTSTIIKRQGLQIFDPISFHGVDNMVLADQVAHLIASWQPDMVFIDAGGGAGVIDRLRQLGHTVAEVNFGGSPSNPMYGNKRAEMWCELKEWLKAGGAIPNHQRLKQDLATPIFWVDNRGRTVLEPKDDIKARGLPSTDYGDAAALCFASPVIKKEVQTSQPHQYAYDSLSKAHIMQDIASVKVGAYNPLDRKRY